MALYTAPDYNPYLVQRPLTESELDLIRMAINSDADEPRDLVEQIVTTVFTALLHDRDSSDAGVDMKAGLDRGRCAIPISQWTAIVGAAYDRAYAWCAGVEVGMDLANRMPGSYDDPQAPSPHLGPADGRPRICRLDVTREAADTIAACHGRVTALAAAYGADSERHRSAADSWRQQLTTLLGTQLAARTVVHTDGPLSLSVSTDSGTGFEIVFHGEPRRCTAVGCDAVVDPATSQRLWRPATPDAHVLDHDHQPSYSFDSPQPGIWTTH
jgi:hypothetical protein